MSIKIMIVDDQLVVRAGLRTIFAERKDMRIIAEAENGGQALELARSHAPDVVFMDISMSGVDGVEATRRIKSEFPGIRVIALTVHADSVRIGEMFRAGAVAYLLKDCRIADYVESVKAAMDGRKYLSKTAHDVVLDAFLAQQTDGENDRSTSEPARDEMKLLSLISNGKSVKEIGSILNMSVRSVHRRRSALMRKFGAETVQELVAGANKAGFIRQ